MTQNKEGKPTVIKMDTMPMKDGEVDVAAILAANGVTGIDLSQVKVIKADNAEEAASIIKEAQKP
jgi:hypothetical protein